MAHLLQLAGCGLLTRDWSLGSPFSWAAGNMRSVDVARSIHRVELLWESRKEGQVKGIWAACHLPPHFPVGPWELMSLCLKWPQRWSSSPELSFVHTGLCGGLGGGGLLAPWSGLPGELFSGWYVQC